MKKTVTALLCISFVFAMGLSPLDARTEITFWTTEVERDRLEVQNNIAAEFRNKTGIRVRVIPVEENLLAERVTAAFAARSLPDVIFHPIDFTIGWTNAGILDPEAAADVIKVLGTETFSPGPLDLARVPGGYAAVPADGWGQLLLYRKDLFDEKGLAAPDHWDSILAAAGALHDPPLMWGFPVATDPSQTYTQQVFEHIALSNGVKLTAKDGELNLNTPEMVETLDFYKSIARFSPPGNLHWLHTRMDYLTGRAAMIIWSPFILDDLSGLRRDQPVIPDIVRGEPGWLAGNTGFVTTIHGPGGAARYGQTNYFGISADANREAARKWVEFLLTEGYLMWLGMAADGKLPVRKGTREEPGRFVDGWMNLEFGVTTRAKISRFYGMDVVNVIMSGADSFERWGFAEGKGALVSKLYGTKIIPQILKRFLDGEITAGQAAEMMDQRVKAME